MKKKMSVKLMVLFLFLLMLFSYQILAISPEDIEADALLMWELLEEVHPNLYHSTPKDVVEVFFEDLMIQVHKQEEYNFLEAYKKMASLGALFRDGHTGIFFPYEEWNNYISAEGKVFPLEVRLEDEKLIIEDPFVKEKIPEETELLSINGIKTETIITRILSSISYESRAFGIHVFNRNFRHYLWALFGMEGPFTITYSSAGEDEETIILPGVRINELPERESRHPFTLEYLTSNSALLIIDSVPLEMNEAYFEFLEESFREIKEKEIEYLLIDMQNNGGGSTHQFNEIFHYLSDTPYRSFSRIDVRYSKPFLVESYPWYGRIYYRIRNFLMRDDIITMEPELRIPPEKDFHFNGQVYLLVGPGSFSAAAGFAALCQDFEAATIVGQETGGLPTSYGDSYYFTLPRTGLRGRSSYKFFVRPSGEVTNRGVIPDWEMEIDQDYQNLLERIQEDAVI